MNSIMRYVLEYINPSDVLRMQDESACKEFVVVGADALEDLFIEIDVDPKTVPSGKIYFQKVGRLTQPKDDQAYMSKRKLACTAIAYFYVRIVQIYVALALTIIDDPQLVPGLGGVPRLTGFQGQRSLLPGRQLGVFQRGGAGEFTIGAWQQAGVIETTATAGEYKFTIDSLPSGEGVFLQRIDNTRARIFRKTFSGGVTPEPTRASLTIELKSAKEDKPPRIRIPIVVRQTGVAANPTLTEDLRRGDVPEYDMDANLKRLLGDSKYEGSSTIANVFKKMLEDLEDPNVGSRKIRDLATRRKQKKEKEETSEDTRAAAAGRKISRTISQGSSVPALAVGTSFGFLTDKRPIAHCVARSLQLLDIDALGSKMPREARTHICQTKFGGTSDGYDIYVPGSGQGIGAAVPGIRALTQLFFVLEQSVRLSTLTEIEYRTALKFLAEKFKGSVPTGSLSLSSIDEIRSPQPNVCGSRTEERILAGQGVSVARAGAARLWARQKAHLGRVDALFKKLFSVTMRGREQTIKINDAVLNGGIPVVNRIADEARSLLIAYYGECEAMYQETVQKLTETSGAFVAPAVPAAAAAPRPTRRL